MTKDSLPTNPRELGQWRLPVGWVNATRRAAAAADMSQAAWVARVLYEAFLEQDRQHLAPALIGDPGAGLPSSPPVAISELARRLGVQIVGHGDGSAGHPLEIRILAPPGRLWACNGLAAIWAAQATGTTADYFWRAVLDSMRQGLKSETAVGDPG